MAVTGTMTPTAACRCAHPYAAHAYFGFCGQCACEQWAAPPQSKAQQLLQDSDLDDLESRLVAARRTMEAYAKTIGGGGLAASTTTATTSTGFVLTPMASGLTTLDLDSMPRHSPSPRPRSPMPMCTDCGAVAVTVVAQGWTSAGQPVEQQWRCAAHTATAPRSRLLEELRAEGNRERRRYGQPFVAYAADAL